MLAIVCFYWSYAMQEETIWAVWPFLSCRTDSGNIFFPISVSPTCSDLRQTIKILANLHGPSQREEHRLSEGSQEKSECPPKRHSLHHRLKLGLHFQTWATRRHFWDNALEGVRRAGAEGHISEEGNQGAWLSFSLGMCLERLMAKTGHDIFVMGMKRILCTGFRI